MSLVNNYLEMMIDEEIEKKKLVSHYIQHFFVFLCSDRFLVFSPLTPAAR